MRRSARLRLLTWALVVLLLTTAVSFLMAFGAGDYRPWLFVAPLIGATALGMLLEVRAHMADDEEVVMPDAMPELGQTRPEVRYPEVLRRPWRCPVCRGSGEVDETLYTRVRGGEIKVTQCRSCNGDGVVWG